MTATLRDPSGPVTLTAWPRRRTPVASCGYALDDVGTRCPTPALYLFRMAKWDHTRFGFSCAEHATTVRGWDGLAWIRLGRPQELVNRGRFTALDPPSARRTR